MDRYLLRSSSKLVSGMTGENQEISKMATDEDSQCALPLSAQIPAQEPTGEEMFTHSQQEMGVREDISGQRDSGQLMGELQTDFNSINYKELTESVIRHLTPQIRVSLENAMKQTLMGLKEEISQHEVRIEEAESRIGRLEDINEQTDKDTSLLQKQVHILADRIEDLENRSRRNNLRVVGLPETIKPRQLQRIFEDDLPEALGIASHRRVERAHRVGPQRSNNTPETNQRPRQAIAKYLDFNDKENILRAFRRRREPLTFQGHKIIIFNDYSVEVNKRRRMFSDCCSRLFKNHIQFQLLYPAILKVRHTDGSSKSFQNPKDAEEYILKLLGKNGQDKAEDRTLPKQGRRAEQSTERDWRRSPKTKNTPISQDTPGSGI